MTLPVSPLAKICDVIREHINTLGKATSPSDWDVTVTIGAPGVNLAAAQSKNTINLFFYRFEPYSFAADTVPGDVQWLKLFCVITAFGIDEGTSDDSSMEFSVGFNELCMLSQVMRLFQEHPVMLVDGDDQQQWRIQYIVQPFSDEQINQIWTSQGDTIYRPSIVYEIALAPIVPEAARSPSTRVGSIGVQASANIKHRHLSWPMDRETRFPVAESISINSNNPQWAPAIVILTGVNENRKASLSVHIEVSNGEEGAADFSSFPSLELWIAGDSAKNNDLRVVGQLLQTPVATDNAQDWQEIAVIDNISADADRLEMDLLPPPSPSADAVSFSLQQVHWTDLNEMANSWQLQLFVERCIKFDSINNIWVDVAFNEAGAVHIRSNPLLVSVSREAA